MPIHLQSYFDLLRTAINKQNELISLSEWQSELLHRAPPVLWFGDIDVKKAKIITIGANPSRSEFLNGNNSTLRGVSVEDVPYLPKDKARFFVSEEMRDAEDYDNDKLELIIKSFNSYFYRNPYKAWFGGPNGGKVEALVNAFHASFYGAGIKQAIHLDLFPFATITDFTKIKYLAERDLFKTGWAQSILLQLLNNIKPELIIIFGISNYKIFCELFREMLTEMNSGKFLNETGEAQTSYFISEFQNIKIAGLSINVGNPRGFSRNDLIMLGKAINRFI